MKKLLAILMLFSLTTLTVSAQEIIKGLKNQGFLLKGSRAMPVVKFKEGISVMLENKEDGMNFTVIKNGKNYPLIDPVASATYGQVAETDVDGDGSTDILAAYRTGPNQFIVYIFKKAQFETDYKMFCSITGKNAIQFDGNSKITLYNLDNSTTLYSLDAEGKLSVIESK
jgi:hypothetical protein